MKRSKTRIKQLLCLGLLGLFPWTLNAESTNEIAFNSIRQLGMGGAGSVVTFGDGSLLQNPATLIGATNKIKILKTAIGIDAASISKVTELFSSLQSSGDAKDSRLDTISGLVPLDNHIDIMMTPISYTSKGFGVGLFSKANINVQFKNKILPQATIKATGVGAAVIGMAKPIEIGSMPLSVGASVKFLNQVTLYNADTGAVGLSLSASELLDLVDNTDVINVATTQASGIGFDVGVLGKLSLPFGKGNWGVQFNNVATTLSGQKTVDSVVEKYTLEVPTTAMVGLGLMSEIPVLGSVKVAADYKLVSPETSFFKNIFMGIEWSIFDDAINVRAGLNQGYVTGGLGAKLWIFGMDYAYFMKETGAEIGDKGIASHLVSMQIDI